VMTFCTPTWISDYTFGAIAERLSYIRAHP
jgi:hypothetical protein